MLHKIRSAAEKYRLFEDVRDVTVALSGGADSVALLYGLLELQDEYGFSLSALHINHLLRGEESDRDEGFVRDLCESLGVPLTVERVNVKELAEKRRQSIELAARNVRYEFFAKYNKGVTATAHTASDSLETLLFNLSRGSGLRGLCGIPPKRDYYIRPLILCTREEIETYLADKGAAFVTDRTNLTDDYARNRLRHHAVPALQTVNPSVEQTASAMCDSLREDADFLDGMAAKIYCLCEKSSGLDAELLCVQHPAVIKRVLMRFLLEQTGLAPDHLHIEEMFKVLHSGGRTSLPGGYQAIRSGNLFLIETVKKQTSAVYSTSVFYESAEKNHNVHNLLFKNEIDCDKIRGTLTVRTRLAGDFIRLAGRNCTKSLKKLFSELKIPPCERDTLPVAADDEGVVWICGVGVSERVAVSADTRRIARIACEKINKSSISGDVKHD